MTIMHSPIVKAAVSAGSTLAVVFGGVYVFTVAQVGIVSAVVRHRQVCLNNAS